MSAWAAYTEELLPAVQAAVASTGAAAWVLLAMAAHESGVPPVAGCSLLTSQNPWGLGCPNNCTNYASLAAAGEDLGNEIPESPVNARAVAADPVAFMEALQADDWSGSLTGYADSVLYYWGPQAQDALTALGYNTVTGQPTYPSESSSGGHAAPPVAAELVTAGLILAIGAMAIVVVERDRRRQ